MILELDKIPPKVHSIVLAISLCGTTSFNYVRNMYLRLLKSDASGAAREVWRYGLSHQIAAPEHHFSVIIGRVERTGDGGWQIVTMHDFVREAMIGHPQLCAGDVLMAINGKAVRPCAGLDPKNTFAHNMKTLARALDYGVTTLTLRRPDYMLTPSQMHRADLKPLLSGETFDLVFDPDGLPGNIGVEFSQKQASIVVKGVDAKKFNPHSLQVLHKWAVMTRCPAPKSVILSNFRCKVPAADRGGTSDVFLRIGYRTPRKHKNLLKGKHYDRHIIRKSQVQKKVKCPAIVEFTDKSDRVEIPISSYLGVLDKCEIDVMDADTFSSADRLLRHQVDITWLFAKGNRERVHCRPTLVPDIQDLPANASFTKEDVWIEFDIELTTE